MEKLRTTVKRSETSTDTSMCAVRIVSLRMTQEQQARAKASRAFERHVSSFLETEIRSPFSYRKLTATSFAVNGKCADEDFDAYVLELHDSLLEFLFGTDATADHDVLVFAGNDVDLARFLTADQDEASDMSAHFVEAARRTVAERMDAKRKGVRSESPGEKKRPLYYRGVLLATHHALIAYTVTPADVSTTQARHVKTDLNLYWFLDALGGDSIGFSSRVFEKISYLLQTDQSESGAPILAVPVSYRTLMSNKYRRQFIDLIESHPDWVRDHMFLSVVGAPANPGSSVAQRFSGEFLPLFQKIDWQIGTAEFNLGQLFGCKLHSVTLDLSRTGNKRQNELDHFIRRIPEIRKQNIRAGLSGIRNREELDLCLKNKAVYVSGDAITSPLAGFGPAQTIDLNLLPIQEQTILGNLHL